MDMLRDREGPLVRAFRAATGASLSCTLRALESTRGAVVPSVGDLAEALQHPGVLADGSRLDLQDASTRERGLPWPAPTAVDAAAFLRDGNRTRWETAAFARQHRLTRAVTSAALTPSSEAALEEVVNGVVLLCEQTSWCWPAHDETASRGAVLADPDHPVLDLGAAGVASQLATIDALLADELDDAWPGVRKRIRRETEMRVFAPLERRRDWHWIGRTGSVHNWNPWIYGDVLLAVLALLDGPADESRRAHLVELCVHGLDVFLAALPADGAVDEGADYWWNGACRALEAVLLLENVTGLGGQLVRRVPSLVATVGFPGAMALGDQWSVSIADSCARSSDSLPWHSLYRAALAVGNEHAAALAVSRARSHATLTDCRFDLSRVVRALADVRWSEALDAPETAQPATLPEHVWLPSVQILVVRDRTLADRPAGLTMTVKGGHNGENHNHLDIGSVTIASAGVPVVVDPGRGTYSATTFGPARYSEWQIGSDWHDVPRVGDRGQAPGPDAAAADVTLQRAHGSGGTDDASIDGLSLELSSAYPEAGLRRWTRTARLDRAAGEVTVRDSWEFRADPPARPTLLRWILAGTVEPIRGGLVLVPIMPAPALTLRWSEGCPGLLDIRHLDDPLLQSVWGNTLTRLTIDVTTVARCVLTAVPQERSAR